MDGRVLRKWCVSACLLSGAIGCHRQSVTSPMDSMPVGTQPISGTPMTSAKKSLWGGSSQPTATPAAEVAVDAPKKGPAKPETLAAFADVRLMAAFDPKTVPTDREGLLDAARQGYQKALQLDSKCKPAMLGLARYYVRVGEREKALDMYKKYLTANPTDKDAAHEVAKVHVSWEDWNGAVAWCEFALKIDPENLTFRKTLAFSLARSGRLEEGFSIMCEVLPEAEARYNIARVLEHQNQQDACRQQLMLALKADPNLASARDFLAELDEIKSPNTVKDPNSGLSQAGYVPQ
jgi:tetratricopeptide (TPR) repeat protein